MPKLFNFVKQNLLALILPLILVGIVVFLAAQNFTPGTFLTGWDTLHPEFNFALNFKRLVFGVWREDQGLGAIAAHSHMAELPRLVFLWLSSLVLPLSFLRYFYFFVCLVLGPLGVYFFFNSFFKEGNKFSRYLSSFIGGVYYLLNIGTLQHFYVPFEMFATQFAALPWLLLLVVKFMREKRKSTLVLLSIVSFLAAPQAYAATLFYAFFGCLILFLGFYSFLSKGKWLNFKKSIVILSTILMTNAFWILPNLYSVSVQSTEIANSKINTNFTPEAVLHNKEFGDIKDVLLNKNFLFSWREYDEKQGKYVDLLDEWQEYLSNPTILAICNSLAAMAIGGVVLSLIKKDKVGLSLFPVLLLSLFFLINQNPPTGVIYEFLQKHLSLLEEGFRMPFTKFSILYMFAFSYYLCVFNMSVLELIKKFLKLNITLFVYTLLISVSIAFVMKPAFGGNLISPSMRNKIPNEYFEMYKWINKEPLGRVATLPLHSFWGWENHNWGYEGAGFIWFGMKHPVLVRDFDRWNADNETFYQEISRSLYNKDKESFNKVLEKYGVSYLLIDKSVTNPEGSEAALFFKESEELLSVLGIKQVAQFGFLTVYKTNVDTGKGFISPSKPYVKVNADSTYLKVDPTFLNGNSYISSDGETTVPLMNLDPRLGIKTEIEGNNLTIGKKLENLKGEYNLDISDLILKEEIVMADVYAKFLSNKLEIELAIHTPEVLVNGEKFSGEPITYKQTFELRDKNIGFLSINSKVFILNKDSSETYLGAVTINTKQKTSISIYGSKPSINSTFLKGLFSRSASLCSDANKEVSYIKNKNGFGLTAGSQSVCLGNEIQLPTKGLNSLTFNSETALFPYFCITQAGVDGCFNDINPTHNSSIGLLRENIYLTSLEKGNYWVAFVAQAQEKGERSVYYNDLKLQTYPLLKEVKLNLGDSFKIFSKTQNFKVTNPKEIKVILPYRPEIVEDFSLNRGHPNAVNCDLKKLGVVTKENRADQVIYGAFQGGVSCDYYDFPKLPHSRGYLMRIVGENQSGRGLKYYLQNRLTNRLDEEKLLPEGQFDELLYLLPPGDSGEGYVINLETRAFGRLNSENILTNLEFMPVPIAWLSNIKLSPVDSTEQIYETNIKVENIKKFGTVYSLSTTSKNEDGLITLSQEFDGGWLAIDLSNRKILSHKEINSWANAWFIPQGRINILIFYAPQLLELIGFTLFLPIVVVFAIMRL